MITKSMKIGEIVRQFPETIQVFSRHKLDCLECQIADLETLEHGAGIHNISINILLEELNNALEAKNNE